MTSDSEVYFIQAASGEGPVKIGYGIAPVFRLIDIQRYSPVRLAILATIPGDRDLERRLHCRFAYAHSHNEWFEPVDELMWAIEQMAVGVPVEAAVLHLDEPTGNIRGLKARQTAINSTIRRPWPPEYAPANDDFAAIEVLGEIG